MWTSLAISWQLAVGSWQLRSCPRPPREPVALVAEAAAGKDVAAFLHRQHELGGVAALQRADVAAVDGRHRGHVTGAQALELAYLDVLEADHVGGLLDRVVHGD